MKHLIAIAALLASVQASAFWGWNDNSQYAHGNAYNNGYADGDAEADFTFDFNMRASMRTEGRGYGNGYGYGYGRGDGYGYNSYIPYYAAPYGFLPPAGVPVVAPQSAE